MHRTTCEENQPDTEREITLVDRCPWFYEPIEPLTEPDPDGLRTSTSALRVALDRLERILAS